MATETRERPTTESWQVRGGALIESAKRLIHEGNVRRVIVKQGDRTVAEFPLTAGVVGAAVAPALAAIGAIAALVAECTVEVERADAPARTEPGVGPPADLGGD